MMSSRAGIASIPSLKWQQFIHATCPNTTTLHFRLFSYYNSTPPFPFTLCMHICQYLYQNNATVLLILVLSSPTSRLLFTLRIHTCPHSHNLLSEQRDSLVKFRIYSSDTAIPVCSTLSYLPASSFHLSRRLYHLFESFSTPRCPPHS